MAELIAGVTNEVKTDYGSVRLVGEMHQHPCSYSSVLDACRKCEPTLIGVEIAQKNLPQTAEEIRKRTEVIQSKREEWEGKQPIFGRTGLGAALEYSHNKNVPISCINSQVTKGEEIESALNNIDLSSQLVADGSLQEAALQERLDVLCEECSGDFPSHLRSKDERLASAGLGLAKETEGVVLIIVGGLHVLTLPDAFEQATTMENQQVSKPSLLFEDIEKPSE